MAKVTLAVDAMGGDYGPSVVLPAALAAVKKHEDLHLILVGEEQLLKARLAGLKPGVFASQLLIHHASEVVAMDELPSQALRYKKDSSMRVAIDLVKEGSADACVSAGNTGALMATARFVLKTMPGIDRPAITTSLPSNQLGQPIRMLDLGANVDSSAEHLLQFAVMGSVLAEAVDKIQNPSVGLLNIGAEEIKGNEQVKQAASLLSECSAINYQGYVEGNELFFGRVDVIVCDGFVGNVALKSSEGSARLIASYIKQAFCRNWWSRLIGLLAKPVLTTIKKRIDPARYNGASLLGLKGIVVKSHGHANVNGFTNAIEEARLQVQQNILQRIAEKVSEILT